MKKLALLAAALSGTLTVAAVRGNIIQNGLVGYWAGDGNANDSSYLGNNGSFAGSYVPGVSGEAFDLSTGFVSIPDSPQYSLSGDYTIDIWFNAHNTGGGSFLGQDNGGGANAKWFLDYGYQGSRFDFHLNGSGGEVFLLSNSIVLPTGWNNLALDKSGNTYTFFLNGKSIGSQTSNVVFSDPSAPLIFGETEGAVPSYRGFLDEVTLYNRALSESEIQTLRNLIPGDLNDDGFINQADVNIITGNTGDSVAPDYHQGDLNGDGFVNSDDWSIFDYDLAIYNVAHPAVAAPEPAVLAFFSLVSLVIRAPKR